MSKRSVFLCGVTLGMWIIVIGKWVEGYYAPADEPVAESHHHDPVLLHCPSYEVGKHD